MYIIDHIEERYERSRVGSASDRLSEFLLINLAEIPETSLSEIAWRAGVSKGYITKYVSDLTEEGTYASFQNALMQELGYTAPDLHELLDGVRHFLDSSKTEPWISEAKIRNIIRQIKQADKIWIIGTLGIRSGVMHLLRMLWADGIPARFINGFSFKL